MLQSTFYNPQLGENRTRENFSSIPSVSLHSKYFEFSLPKREMCMHIERTSQILVLKKTIYSALH